MTKDPDTPLILQFEVRNIKDSDREVVDASRIPQLRTVPSCKAERLDFDDTL